MSRRILLQLHQASRSPLSLSILQKTSRPVFPCVSADRAWSCAAPPFLKRWKYDNQLRLRVGALGVRVFSVSSDRFETGKPGGLSHDVQPPASRSTPTPTPAPTPPTSSPTTPPTITSALKARLPAPLVHENIYTLPNLLTFSRLIAAPAVGYLVLHDYHAWAAGLFFYAGVTDLIDGWIARRWNQQTVVGSIIDPLADKALMTILTICLAIKGGLPIWLATLILGRDISLAIAATYYRYASLPLPKTFARYWNFSLPSAEVHPTQISKYNTFLQLLLIGATTIMPIVGPSVDAFLHGTLTAGVGTAEVMRGAQILVAATTVWSGVGYLYRRDAVKILGQASPERKRAILRRGRVVLGVSFLVCGVVALALEAR